jgi:hypothetical protein
MNTTNHSQHLENKLKQQLEICRIHADRIGIALKHIEPLLPLSTEKTENFSDEQLGFLELLTSRIGKLQDAMGMHIFPITLELLGEKNEQQSMLDRLNRLEKLGFIEQASFWQYLRNLRNELTHEYENDLEKQTSKINHAIKAANELLDVWGVFIKKAQETTTISGFFNNAKK